MRLDEVGEGRLVALGEAIDVGPEILPDIGLRQPRLQERSRREEFAYGVGHPELIIRLPLAGPPVGPVRALFKAKPAATSRAVAGARIGGQGVLPSTAVRAPLF